MSWKSHETPYFIQKSRSKWSIKVPQDYLTSHEFRTSTFSKISWRLKTNELRLTKVLVGYPRSKVWYCIIGIIRPWIRVPDSTTRIRFRKDRWSLVYFPFTPPEIFHIDILKSPCIWKPEMQHFLLLNFGCVELQMAVFFPWIFRKRKATARSCWVTLRERCPFFGRGASTEGTFINAWTKWWKSMEQTSSHELH